MTTYYRPIAMQDAVRPPEAVPLAGGWCWFSQAEKLSRSGSEGLVPARSLPTEVLKRLTSPRTGIAGLPMDTPRLMGILNVTPDSFSDGGKFAAPDVALAQALKMVDDGADVLDIGGESTRPGADFVPAQAEIARTAPVIKALCRQIATPISIDTRKAAVARAAKDAGARLLNDVSALSFDSDMVRAAETTPVCLMHAQGDPKTMQKNPSYDNVLLDVYDYLADRIVFAENAGLKRSQIIIDPGIGFGKTADHNLQLIRNLSLFHGLGCPILLGASRKRFIGTIGAAPDATDRAPGSIAIALAGVKQGVQITRVHDIMETRQAFSLWQSVYPNKDSEV